MNAKNAIYVIIGIKQVMQMIDEIAKPNVIKMSFTFCVIVISV